MVPEADLEREHEEQEMIEEGEVIIMDYERQDQLSSIDERQQTSTMVTSETISITNLTDARYRIPKKTLRGRQDISRETQQDSQRKDKQ